jgi:hypothetical protein
MGSGGQGAPAWQGSPEGRGGEHGVQKVSTGAYFGEVEGATLPLDGAGASSALPTEDGRGWVSA